MMRFWSRMLNQPRERLAQRLRERIASLSESAADGQTLDPDALQEVESLLRVAEMQSTTRGRWRISAFAAVAMAMAMTVGLLLLARVDVVDVEGTIEASAIEILLGSNRPVLPMDQPLRSFSAAGMTGVRGIQPRGEVPHSLSVTPLSGGTLTLQQVSLTKDTRVGVKSDGRGQVSLRIKPVSPSGRVALALTGRSRIVLAQGTQMLATQDQLLSLDFGPERFDMSFVPVDSAVELLTGIIADSLNFTEQRVPTDGALSDVTLISTIIGGAITFPGMRDHQVVLRAREHIDMDVRSLQVHRVRVTPTGVIIEFRARVSGITLGSEEVRQDLRPSVLEWYAANRRLELARTVFVSTLLMLAGLIAWWRANR